MSQLLSVRGGRRLEGEVTIQGAKNSVLPILAATLRFLAPRAFTLYASSGFCRHWSGSVSPAQLIIKCGRFIPAYSITSPGTVISTESTSVRRSSTGSDLKRPVSLRPTLPFAPHIHIFCISSLPSCT